MGYHPVQQKSICFPVLTVKTLIDLASTEVSNEYFFPVTEFLVTFTYSTDMFPPPLA